MITRQRPVGEFFPLTGRGFLVAQAIQTAALSPAHRVLVCGGEERGTWLLERGVASKRTFAFALALGAEPTGALARISLEAVPDTTGEFSLLALFEALSERQNLERAIAPGVRLTLDWA